MDVVVLWRHQRTHRTPPALYPGDCQWELTHYARRYMSNGMIHVQQSFRKIACALNKFLLVDSCFLDTRSSDSRYNFRPIRIQDTGCLLASDWSKIVPLYDVSAATGPCIQKSTFNKSELVYHTHNFTEWPLDMYHSIGHVSPYIVWLNLHRSSGKRGSVQCYLGAYKTSEISLVF